MKILKKILLSYFLFHFALVFFVNIVSFSKFDKTTKGLNKVGKICVDMVNSPNLPKNIKNTLGFYANITGVNRGYEFFSPNVAEGQIKLEFISGEGKELNLLKSFESEIKLLTFTLFFTSNVKEKTKRDKLIKSICRRLFSKNPTINEIKIFADIKSYKRLEKSSVEKYMIKNEKILLTKIFKS